LATDLRMWDAEVAALKDRYRILRYDQRGHGASAPPPPGTDFEALTGDLIALLAHFAITKATLVGVSMGAVTVLRCAARAPDLVRAVIACDGQWMAPATALATWGERIAIAEAQGVQALVQPTIGRWFQADFAARQPANAAKVADMIGTTPLAGYVGCAKALQSYDFRADFPKMSVPILFLVGEKDGVMPKVMAEMAQATPGSRFHAIPAAGHLPNLERPDAFLAAMTGFLAA
jgi:3-oxoadipate enol-lactonase